MEGQPIPAKCGYSASRSGLQSGRGQPHSKTLADFQRVLNFAAASWSAAVLCRFLLMRVCLVPALVESQQTVLPWWGERWHWPAFIFFLLCWSVAVAVSRIKGAFEDDWMTSLVVMSAVLTSLVTLGRQLPLQNVMCIALVSVMAAGWAEFFKHVRDWQGINWRTMVFWIVVLLNARGVAQFLLQRRRQTRFYGLEEVGVAGGIVVMSAAVISSEPILYKLLPVLVLSFFGASAFFLLLLPVLMNKRPVEPPVSWQPIVVLPLLLLWAFLPRI